MGKWLILGLHQLLLSLPCQRHVDGKGEERFRRTMVTASMKGKGQPRLSLAWPWNCSRETERPIRSLLNSTTKSMGANYVRGVTVTTHKAAAR